ncbi:MAG TPA: hypothetical protein VLA69_03020 [Gaiellaceae bacterium]|nr:hypothetical protein [Gaiellaceae bacterium]
MAAPPERTAVLVIRAWLEDDDAEPRLRARITSTLEVSATGLRDTSVVAAEQEIVRAVRTWLRAFVAGR